MGIRNGLAVALCLYGLGFACGPSVAFECDAPSECERGREGGVCEAGYCAFVDGDCPSLHRWGEHAPDDIAGECVPWDSDDPDAGSSAGGKGGLDGATDPLDDGTDGSDGDAGPMLDDGDTTGPEPEPEPEPPAEAEWICASEDLFDLDPAAFDGTLPGGWMVGATGSSPAMLIRTEDALALHLDDGGPGIVFIEHALDGDAASAMASGVQLTGADAHGFIEILTDVPYRIERDGTHVTIPDAEDPELAPIFDAEIDPTLTRHLRVVLTASEVRYEASGDGATFMALAVRPRGSDAPPSLATIGLSRTGTSPFSAELLLTSVSTCAPS